MDKGFLVFMAFGIGVLYLTVNFIGGIQEEDDTYRNNEYRLEHQYDQYKTTDSVGDEVIDVTGAPISTQFVVWNTSSSKNDFLNLFPDFEEMRFFVNDHIRGKKLTEKLNTLLNSIEDKFFSGDINTEQAKKELGSLK